MIGHAHKNTTHDINSIIINKGTLNSIATAYHNGLRLSDGDFSVIMLRRLYKL
jgi:hypothetical protein